MKFKLNDRVMALKNDRDIDKNMTFQVIYVSNVGMLRFKESIYYHNSKDFVLVEKVKEEQVLPNGVSHGQV